MITDGAMATYLFSKGAASPVEELNLTAPALVTGVHREYLDAGAQILRTNTFFSRRAEVNQAGVRIAREAAQGKALVAGVIGSAGGTGTRELFRQHAAALEGVDLYILETFTGTAELRAAIEAVRDVTRLTLIAQFSVGPSGDFPDDFASVDADILGFNCSAGPESVLLALKRLRPLTAKPFSALPSANIPAQFSPEQMAAYAGRFIAAGAVVVGACCGSTPEHIRAIAGRHATLVEQWPPT
jgi:homocysteine S-methyltransferase